MVLAVQAAEVPRDGNPTRTQRADGARAADDAGREDPPAPWAARVRLRRTAGAGRRARRRRLRRGAAAARHSRAAARTTARWASGTSAAGRKAARPPSRPRRRWPRPSILELAYASGRIMGREARDRGFNVLLAGGVGIERDAWNGRNFEYLGEDPILAGPPGDGAAARHPVARRRFDRQAPRREHPGDRSPLGRHDRGRAIAARDRPAARSRSP